MQGGSRGFESPRLHQRGRVMWVVYVLRSLQNGTHYVGSTDNLERRLREHNSGKSKCTRHVRPLELVYNEACGERLEARRRERYLKSGQGREFLKRALGRAVAAGDKSGVRVPPAPPARPTKAEGLLLTIE